MTTTMLLFVLGLAQASSSPAPCTDDCCGANDFVKTWFFDPADSTITDSHEGPDPIEPHIRAGYEFELIEEDDGSPKFCDRTQDYYYRIINRSGGVAPMTEIKFCFVPGSRQYTGNGNIDSTPVMVGEHPTFHAAQGFDQNCCGGKPIGSPHTVQIRIYPENPRLDDSPCRLEFDYTGAQNHLGHAHGGK